MRACVRACVHACIRACVREYVQAVLTDISTDRRDYARDSDLFAFKPRLDDNCVVPHSTGENIVVEFRFAIVIHVLCACTFLIRC